MKKQRQKKDFSDEFKDNKSESGFDKSTFDEYDFEEQNANEKSSTVNNKQKRLGHNNVRVQLKFKNCIFRLV